MTMTKVFVEQNFFEHMYEMVIWLPFVPPLVNLFMCNEMIVFLKLRNTFFSHIFQSFKNLHETNSNLF